MTQRLRVARIILIAKGKQIQNQTFHTQAKAHRSRLALIVAGGLAGLSFHACPLAEVQGFGAVLDSDSQVTMHQPCPPSKADTCLWKGPVLLLPDIPWIQPSRLGTTSQGQQGPIALSNFFSERKGVSENLSPWGSRECWG